MVATVDVTVATDVAVPVTPVIPVTVVEGTEDEDVLLVGGLGIMGAVDSVDDKRLMHPPSKISADELSTDVELRGGGSGGTVISDASDLEAEGMGGWSLGVGEEGDAGNSPVKRGIGSGGRCFFPRPEIVLRIL